MNEFFIVTLIIPLTRDFKKSKIFLLKILVKRHLATTWKTNINIWAIVTTMPFHVFEKSQRGAETDRSVRNLVEAQVCRDFLTAVGGLAAAFAIWWPRLESLGCWNCNCGMFEERCDQLGTQPITMMTQMKLLERWNKGQIFGRMTEWRLN